MNFLFHFFMFLFLLYSYTIIRSFLFVPLSRVWLLLALFIIYIDIFRELFCFIDKHNNCHKDERERERLNFVFFLEELLHISKIKERKILFY